MNYEDSQKVPYYTNIKWYINQHEFWLFDVNLSCTSKCSE